MDELLATIPLTPDVSRTSPDLYRSTLLYKLAHNTQHGKTAFEYVVGQRKVSPDNITFKPETWNSGHDMDEGTISLGTAPMSETEKQAYFPFETNGFTDERVILHTFSHEISHFLGEAIADTIETNEDISPTLKQYEAFMCSFANFRREANKGMTSHAGSERYIQKGADIRAVEDMTDLLAFYLVDPNYLERYLQFLSDPVYAEERDIRKLITPQPQVGTIIYRNIVKVVADLLAK